MRQARSRNRGAGLPSTAASVAGGSGFARSWVRRALYLPTSGLGGQLHLIASDAGPTAAAHSSRLCVFSETIDLVKNPNR